MRKILLLVLAACILLTAAGCNGENTPPGSASGSDKAESTQNPEQTPGSTVPEGAPADLSDVPFAFNASTVKVSMKPLGLTDPSQYQFIEDADGISHLIYIEENGNLCHRYLNNSGVWSDAQVIEANVSLDQFNEAYARGEVTELSTEINDFYTLFSPDGELCVVWTKGVTDLSGSSGWRYPFYTAYYRNGSFEQSSSFEYPTDDETQGSFRIDFVYFDAQGKIQCLYNTSGSGEGYFLSGNRLTHREWKETLEEIPTAEGLNHWGTFMVDSQGICHIFNMEGEESADDQPLLHSYSTDNGVTWEGPFTVLTNLHDGSLHCSSFLNGDIQLIITINHGWERKKLVLCTLKADTYEVAYHQEYFNYLEMTEAVGPDLHASQFASFQDCHFTSAYHDADGLLQLMGYIKGGHVGGTTYYLFEQDRKGEWDIRMITGQEDMELGGLFLRSNGSLFVFGMYKQHELYLGEVAW